MKVKEMQEAAQSFLSITATGKDDDGHWDWGAVAPMVLHSVWLAAAEICERLDNQNNKIIDYHDPADPEA